MRYAENRHAFWWFGHSWGHTQAHTVANLSSVIEDMQLNQGFAKVRHIGYDTSDEVKHGGLEKFLSPFRYIP